CRNGEGLNRRKAPAVQSCYFSFYMPAPNVPDHPLIADQNNRFAPMGDECRNGKNDPSSPEYS
ncbi:hypothetical protein ACNVD4_24805, partial [Rhizobium sp. BR5]